MVLVDNAKLFAPLDAATLARGTAVSPKPRPLDRHRRPLYRVRLQPGQTDRSAAARSRCWTAKPEWKGRWAASPSGADFRAIVSALLELKGEKRRWVAESDETNFTAYKGNSTVMKAVNAGGSIAA